MIYFVQAVDGGEIKIGQTIRLTSRLKGLEKQRGCKLRVLGVTPGSFADEAAIHGRFIAFRRAGEWFDPNPEILEFIEAECRPWDGNDEAGKMASIKVSADLVATARIAAAMTGFLLGDYLASVLTNAVESDIEEWRAKELGR